MPHRFVFTPASTDDGATSVETVPVPNDGSCEGMLASFSTLVKDMLDDGGMDGCGASSDAEPVSIELPGSKASIESLVAYMVARWDATRQSEGGSAVPFRKPPKPLPETLEGDDMSFLTDSISNAHAMRWSNDETIDMIKMSTMLQCDELKTLACAKLAFTFMKSTTDEVRGILGITSDMTMPEEIRFRQNNGIPLTPEMEEAAAREGAAKANAVATA